MTNEQISLLTVGSSFVLYLIDNTWVEGSILKNDGDSVEIETSKGPGYFTSDIIRSFRPLGDSEVTKIVPESTTVKKHSMLAGLKEEAIKLLREHDKKPHETKWLRSAFQDKTDKRVWAQINDILNSLEYTIKIHENKPDSDRMVRLTQQVKLLHEEIKSSATLALKGELAFQRQKYDEAKDYWFEASCYHKGFEAALKNGDADAVKYGLMALDSNVVSTDISLFSALAPLCNTPDHRNEFLKNTLSYLPYLYEPLIFCAILFLSEDDDYSKIDLTKLDKDTAQQIYEFLLNKYPNTIKDKITEDQTAISTYTESKSENILIGNITKFLANYKFGNIIESNGDNYFFHIAQIKDNNLAVLLEQDFPVKELPKVRFKIGYNYKGPAACEIEPIQSLFDMLVISPDNVEELPTQQYETGFLKRWFGDHGYIERNGKSDLPIQLSSISDLVLRYFCENNFSTVVVNKNLELSFQVRKLPTGKDVAENVTSLTPFTPDIECEAKNARYDIFHANNTGYSKIQKQSSKEIMLEILNTAKRESFYRSLPFEDQTNPYPPMWRSTPENSVLESPSPIIKQQFSIPVKPLSIDKSKTGYYEKAKTLLLKKDRQKEAQELLELALKANEKMESTIPDLASLYIRLAKYDEAFKLLDDYGSQLESEKHRNILISLYSASKHDNAKLLQLYKESISSEKKANTKLHYIQQKYLLEQSLGLFEDVLRSCDQWEYLANRMPNFTPLPQNAYLYTKRTRAIALYCSGKKEEAQKLAKELLVTLPDDLDLQNLLEDRLDPIKLKSSTYSMISINAYDQLDLYIKDKLDRTTLKDVLKTKHIKDDMYSGILVSAEQEYGNLTGRAASLPAAEQARWLLSSAKYILNYLRYKPGHEKSEVLNENYFHRSIVNSLQKLAEAELSMQPIHIDTVRYYYCLAIKLSKVMKVKIDLICKYIFTYFYNPDELSFQTFDTLAKLQGIRNHEPKDIRQFNVGLYILFSSCASENLHKDILDNLYYNLMELWLPEEQEQGNTLMLSYRLNNERRLYEENLSRLRRFLLDKRLDFMSLGFLDELKNNLFSKYCDFYGQDAIYNNSLVTVLDRFRDFIRQQDFDTRASTLNDICTQSERLIAEIEQYPTEYAYECLVPILKQSLKLGKEELKKLYENRPVLSVETLAPERRGQLVTLVLRIINQNGRQKADNIKPDIRLINDEIQMKISNIPEYVKGGEVRECSLHLTLPITSTMDSIELEVLISYEYYQTIEKKCSHIYKKIITFSLQNQSDFKQIPNPFSVYASHGVVEDPAMVFGREGDIESILKSICDDAGNLAAGKSIALYGQKRTGKSTLLYHVRKQITEIFPKTAIIIDLGSLGAYDYNESSLTRSIMVGILSNIQNIVDYDDDLFNMLEKHNLNIPIKLVRTQECYDSEFQYFMKRFISLLEERNPNCRLVVFLDEFTYLYNYALEKLVNEQFLRFWKSFTQQFRCVSIIVGQDSMKHLQELFTNELGATKLYKVNYLTYDSSVHLVRKPLERKNAKVIVHTEAVDKLFEYSAGSAYLLMILCSNLVEFLNKKMFSNLSSSTIDQLVDDLLRSGEIGSSEFHPLFNDSTSGSEDNRDEKNIRLLHDIARQSENFSLVSRGNISISGMTKDEVDVLLGALERRDVLRRHEGRYEIIVKLFSRWLSSYYGRELEL